MYMGLHRVLHLSPVHLTQHPVQTVADEHTPHPVQERSSVILMSGWFATVHWCVKPLRFELSSEIAEC